MDLKRDFDSHRCVVLRKILNANGRKHHTVSTLGEEINEPITAPLFQEVWKYLKENGVVIEKETVGRNQYLIINHKKIIKILDNQDYIDKWVKEYFRPYRPIP